MLVPEFSAHVSTVEVVGTGVTIDEHCGGLVVLRWKPGLDGSNWLGGLQFVEKARRWVLLVEKS